MDRPLEVALKEQNQDQVAHHLEGAAQAVFGVAVQARVVPHVHLGHAGALYAGQHRNEAVHLAVEVEVLGHLQPEDFERAAVVVEVHARQPANEGIGNSAGDFAQQHSILPIAPPSRHYVPTARLQFVAHGQDVERVVLQIAVHRDDVLPPGSGNARRHGRGLPVVAVEDQQADVAVGQLLDAGHRAIGRAVIHQNQFVRLPRQGRADAFEQGSDVVFFVEQGDDDGKLQRHNDRARV